MNIELTNNELELIKKALKHLINKDGIPEAQEIYLHNTQNAMPEEANKQFELDNKKDWHYL
tara:strand:+ start:78 stop:260 length:183 start_codon:yes stop_codon:yes gene_type:complete